MISMHKLAPEKNTERKKKGTSLVFVKGRVWHIEQNGFKLHLIKNQNSKQTKKQKIKDIKSRHSAVTLVSFIHAPLDFLLDLEILDFEQWTSLELILELYIYIYIKSIISEVLDAGPAGSFIKKWEQNIFEM